MATDMTPPDPETDADTDTATATPVAANDESHRTTQDRLTDTEDVMERAPPTFTQSSESLESISVSLESISVSDSVVSDYASVTAAVEAEEEAVVAPEPVPVPAPEPVPVPVAPVPAPVPVPVPAVTIDREPVRSNPNQHSHSHSHTTLSLPECLYGPLAHSTAATAAAQADADTTSPTDAFAFTPCPTLEQLQEQQHTSPDSHVIHLPQLRKIAAAGIPDDDDCDSGDNVSRHLSCRGVTWRVLLGMLPVETADWKTVCETQRQQYLTFCQDLFDETDDVHIRAPELRGRQWRWRQQCHDNDDSETSHTESEHSTAAGAAANNFNTNNDKDDGTSDNFVPVTETAEKPISDSDHSDRPQSERSSAPSHSQRPPQVLPAAVKDYWKKQGKDLHVLEQLTRNMNALHLQESVHATSTSSNHSENASAAATAAAAAAEEPWQDFVESAVLLDEIRKDVVRTHPDLAFYLEPGKGPRRYAALERILFVWSKYNKGVRYVQGMNEIVGTIYYVLANDWNDSWADHAEADTYWLLNTLLSEMRDVFISDMDESDTGIQGRIANMHTLLGRHDPEVKEHLEDCGIDASFYAIRWWTTLLSREFLLPDTIRLWDSMFASTHKDNFLRYVCVTMVMVIREDLLKGDFSTCLRLLQGYPPTHMDHLVESSRALWIYESQITLACHKGGISLHQALQTISPPPAVIMAFGVRDGVVSDPVISRADQLEEAKEQMAATVREATTAVATKAQGLFGRASKLYSKYSKEVQTRYRTRSGDGANDVTNGTSSASESESVDESTKDSIYLDAFR